MMHRLLTGSVSDYERFEDVALDSLSIKQNLLPLRDRNQGAGRCEDMGVPKGKQAPLRGRTAIPRFIALR